MGIFDKLKPHLQKAHKVAEEKAKDPEFQAKIKAAVERQTRRPNADHRGGAATPARRAFGGGGPGTPGYPWMPGDPMYGLHANPGFYDQDGQWCEHDSDGDGVPDSQDAAPNDPDIQTADQADQATYGGEPDEPGGEAYDPGASDQGMTDVPDAEGDTYDGGGGVDPGYSESSPADYGGGGGDYGGGGDSGGFDGGGGGE